MQKTMSKHRAGSLIPDPPQSIPENVCTETCNVCERRWFENTVTMVRCECKALRICPSCALEMKRPEEMEHNLVDCNFKAESSPT